MKVYELPNGCLIDLIFEISILQFFFFFAGMVLPDDRSVGRHHHDDLSDQQPDSIEDEFGYDPTSGPVPGTIVICNYSIVKCLFLCNL